MNKDTLAIEVPAFTGPENERLNNLLQGVQTGYYWQNEGWSDEHLALLPGSLAALEEFLSAKLKPLKDARALLLALHANAAESPEWIRARIESSGIVPE
jgi:hypothetical protein